VGQEPSGSWDRGQLNRSIALPCAALLPPDRSRRKKPGWFAPVIEASDAGDPEPVFSLSAREHEFADPTIKLIMESFAAAEEIIRLSADRLKAELTETRTEVSALRNALGALKNENAALKLILENLRVTQRGERGVDGDRGPLGRDGRDGAPGALGPRGEAGPRGEPAPRIASWTIDEERFLAAPHERWLDRRPVESHGVVREL
jgi:hypothetical protein